jgi:hypothetical protein
MLVTTKLSRIRTHPKNSPSSVETDLMGKTQQRGIRFHLTCIQKELTAYILEEQLLD